MDPGSFRLALAQLNSSVGDVAGNAAKIIAARTQAQAAGAELVVLPELFLSGAPLQGLALNAAFQDACRKACEELARITADGGPGLLIGLPWREAGGLYNAAALLDGGVIQSVRFKASQAGRGLRDETGLFQPGPMPGPLPFRDRIRLGLAIGEDLWSEEVVECLTETGAELVIASAASPYRHGIGDERMNVAVARVVESGLPLALVNQIGGQGELVFDGASYALSGDRELIVQSPAFREALTITGWQRARGQWRCDPGERATIETGDDADYAALMLGLRDHVAKAGASGVVLWLSDAVSSGLCAALAVDALGPARVACVAAASDLAIAGSNAAACADALGVRLKAAPIAPTAKALETAVASMHDHPAPRGDAAGQRLEEASRNALLEVLAGDLGWLLLGASTRSELLTGLRSRNDPENALNPLGDISSTQARRLAELRNRWKPAGALGPEGVVIPLGVATSHPMSLPGRPLAMETLDAILDLLVEQGLRVSEVVARGYDIHAVTLVESLLRNSQRARRAQSPVIRISARSVEGSWSHPAESAFVDTGAPRFEPDAALLKGVGRAPSDSFDI